MEGKKNSPGIGGACSIAGAVFVDGNASLESNKESGESGEKSEASSRSVETFRVFSRELRFGALDSSIESAGKRVRDVVVVRNQARVVGCVWVEIGYQPENADSFLQPLPTASGIDHIEDPLGYVSSSQLPSYRPCLRAYIADFGADFLRFVAL
jgi:hypothetical protein